MDYDKKTLEIIKEMRDQMEEFGDSVDKVADQLLSLNNQLKQVSKESEKTENTGQQIGSQMSTIGSIGSSAAKTVGDLVKNIGGQALKAVPVIGNLFSILEIGGDIISAVAGEFSAQPVVDEIKEIEKEYKAMRESIGGAGAIELYKVENIDTLIDRIESLQSKTSITKSEQQEYNELVTTLGDKLPDVAGLLENQNQKYSAQLDLLRNINDEQGYAIIDQKITEAEEAAQEEVNKKYENYDDKQKDLQKKQEDLDATKLGTLVKAVRDDVTRQIRDKYGLDPLEPLTEYQSGLVDSIISLFEDSSTIDDFFNKSFWQVHGLSNEKLKKLYEKDPEKYNVYFGGEINRADYTYHKTLVEEAADEAEKAYIEYDDAVIDFNNKTFLGDVFNGMLRDVRTQAEHKGREGVVVEEALLDRMSLYGYYVTDTFYAAPIVDADEYNMSQYENKSASQMLLDDLDAADSQKMLEFINGFLNLDTLSQYVDGPNSVDQLDVNNAMLELKPYLPEGVDINTPQKLTEGMINNIWSEYLQDNEGLLTSLYNSSVDILGILEDMDKGDEAGIWQENVISPLYEWLAKDVKVVFKPSRRLMIAMGLIEDDSEDNNALGTAYYGGGRTWVGEHGPELLDLPRESSYAGTNTGGVIVTGNTVHVAQKPDIEQIAAELVAKLEETLFNMP